QYSFVTPLTSLVVVKPNGTSAADLEGARRPGVPFASSGFPDVNRISGGHVVALDAVAYDEADVPMEAVAPELAIEERTSRSRSARFRLTPAAERAPRTAATCPTACCPTSPRTCSPTCATSAASAILPACAAPMLPSPQHLMPKVPTAVPSAMVGNREESDGDDYDFNDNIFGSRALGVCANVQATAK
ncbi:Protein of unknown function, partial [Gryllus bimaculatus]